MSSTTTAGSAPLISLLAAGVNFGGSEVLRDVTFAVKERSLVAIIGADGAGKSTLLRLLAGLRRPSKGVVHRVLPRTDLGFCGSGFDLYSDLTVRENLRFFASVRGMRGFDLGRAIEGMLEAVGLLEAADRLAGDLSGGMKKKLGLAAALIHSPKLLLLDEPTVALDPASRREVWDIIAQAHSAGTAVVFATTYLDEAERARQVVLLAGGRATELSPSQVSALACLWKAWAVSVEASSSVLRSALARARLGPRAYLRAGGLVVLARDLAEAKALVQVIVRNVPPEADMTVAKREPVLQPAGLSLDDVLVLTLADAQAAQSAGQEESPA